MLSNAGKWHSTSDCRYFGASQETEVVKGHMDSCQKCTKKLLKQKDSTWSAVKASSTEHQHNSVSNKSQQALHIDSNHCKATMFLV